MNKIKAFWVLREGRREASPDRIPDSLLKLVTGCVAQASAPRLRAAAGTWQRGVYHPGSAPQLVWELRQGVAAAAVLAGTDCRNAFGRARRAPALRVAECPHFGLAFAPGSEIQGLYRGGTGGVGNKARHVWILRERSGVRKKKRICNRGTSAVCHDVQILFCVLNLSCAHTTKPSLTSCMASKSKDTTRSFVTNSISDDNPHLYVPISLQSSFTLLELFIRGFACFSPQL